jgi:hypothetical protein
MRAWQQAGVFDRLDQSVLDQLGQPEQLHWSWAALDSVSVRAKTGAS